MGLFGDYSGTRVLPTGASADDVMILRSEESPRVLYPLDSRSARHKRKNQEATIDLQYQFRLFNLSPSENGLTSEFVDPHLSAPTVEGDDDQPDVITRINLIAFHPGAKIEQEIGKNARATLRLDVGQDEMSDSPLEPLFWSIAAGLDLKNTWDKKEAPKKFRSDFDKAFARRPIEIAGGLAEMRFEVFAHDEPPWWRKIFGALGSAAATPLINALGFPGIVNEAVDVLNEAFDKFDRDAEPIFKSAKMTFAMSERARHHYTLGMPGVHVGVLPAGFTLMVPQRHYETIRSTHPYFLGAWGRLVPQGVSIEEFNSSTYDDPYKDIPYALLKIQTKAATLEADFL